MRNIKMILEYDGTRYNGWQKQNNTENTIQGKLNEIISKLLEEDVEIIGSGRTDAGVHAYGQVANFKTKSTIDLKTLLKNCNKTLSNDISIKEMAEADERFHARYNAVSKKYIYRIWNHEQANVFERKYSAHHPGKLDIAQMKEAAELLVGEHDFKAFSSDKRNKKSTMKKIYTLEITKADNMIQIECHGNSFLYNMVRIIAGTLIEVGSGKRKVQSIKEILESKDRQTAGFTALPNGLFLQEVCYK